MGLKLTSIQIENPGAPKLVILHGLMGSSRNWAHVAKTLSERFEVHLLDLRNHGHSPWADSMAWSELSSDLVDYLEIHAPNEPINLLGHSLGGKIALYFAAHFEQRVNKLVVVDIAPKEYQPHFRKEFKALLSLPIESIKSRQEASDFLAGEIPDQKFRESLLANMKRDGAGYTWMINLAALYANQEIIRTNPLEGGARIKVDTLLIKGAESDFVQSEDFPSIHELIPQVKLITMEAVGHNPHTEDRERLVDLLLGWL